MITYFKVNNPDGLRMANTIKGAQEDKILPHSFEEEDWSDLLHLPVRQHRTWTQM